MKFKKLIAIDFDDNFFGEEYHRRLQSISDNIVFVNEKNVDKRNKLIKDADGLLIRYFTPVDKVTIEDMPNLKYIGASSVAVDQIDVEYAKERGIVVTNVAGYSSNSVAEFVFAVLLSHLRSLYKAEQNVQNNDFAIHPEYQGWELNGKTFGIVGLGNIGKRVSEIAKGFNMQVQYHSRNRKQNYEDMGLNYVAKQELFSTSDVLGIFLEFNKDTKEFIAKEYLELVKENAVIVSITHTEVFNLKALINLLNTKNIKFIQTYFNSISDEHRNLLNKTKNVILYPSIAVATKEAKERVQNMLVNNIDSFSKGIIINEI